MNKACFITMMLSTISSITLAISPMDSYSEECNYNKKISVTENASELYNPFGEQYITSLRPRTDANGNIVFPWHHATHVVAQTPTQSSSTITSTPVQQLVITQIHKKNLNS